jgi:hypothetical protein
MASSVSANPPQMVVTGSPSLPSWIENASRAVDSALERVDVSRSQTGVTYVRFNCDENGKPQNIKTVKNGRYNPTLEHVGRQTIRRIRTLHPMFVGAEKGQEVEAAIVVADNQRQLDHLLVEVNERAREQNAKWAARGLPNPIISLAVVGKF